MYLIEEQKTGLFDGYYFVKSSAKNSLKYLIKEFPDLDFILLEIEQKKFRELHDCEMINCSSWYYSRYEKK